MVGRISELVLTPKCAPQKKLCIAFVSEAKTPMKLHGTVTSEGEGLAALSLGHSDSFFYLVVVLLSDQRCRAPRLLRIDTQFPCPYAFGVWSRQRRAAELHDAS